MSSRRKPQSRICACGCNEATAGGEFRQGHDAKLRSKYLQRIDDGDETAIEEFLTERPKLAYPYGYTEANLRERLGCGVKR